MKLAQFKKIMNACLAISEEADGLSTAIKDYFDGHAVCTIGSGSIEIIYRALEESIRGKELARMEDGREWSDISWWVYETECGKKNATITHQDGTTVNIRRLEDLYCLILQDAEKDV